jgi:hypothetical protein
MSKISTLTELRSLRLRLPLMFVDTFLLDLDRAIETFPPAQLSNISIDSDWCAFYLNRPSIMRSNIANRYQQLTVPLTLWIGWTISWRWINLSLRSILWLAKPLSSITFYDDRCRYLHCKDSL